MAATPPSKPFVLLRRTLLLAFVVFLVVVATTYVIRQRNRSTLPTPTRSPMEEAEPHLILTGEGFDYALTEEGKKLFHIRAKRILSEGEDDYVLEEVEIEITRDDGGIYQVEGGRAEVNLATNRATLDGGVRFHGPRGLEMTTEGLEVRHKGNLMVSSAPVEFGFLGRFTGRADHLRANARKNNFVLAGEVAIDTFPGDEVPMSLRSLRLVYDRDIKLVRLEGNVELRRAGSEIRARRLALKLAEDENTLAFARAYWEVEGRLEQESSEGVPRAVELSGNELSILFVEGTDQPLKAELEGDGTRLAMLTFDDGLGLKQRIQSDYLLADFDQGNPRLTQAFDRVQIDEFIALAPEPVLRRICADSAEASLLASGDIDEVRLLGDVEVQDGESHAHGDRVRAEFATDGEVELVGDLARVWSPQGRLEAPRIVHNRATGEIHAGEPVSAWVEGVGRLSPTGLETGSEPIRVQGREAVWSEAAQTVLFRGDVRAWQGENFMLADELLGDTTASTLTATGSVRTTWHPEPEKTPKDVEGLPAEPLEVDAPKLVYDQKAGVLTYSGGVQAVQGLRLIRCQELLANQAEGGGVGEITCRGQVLIDDKKSGNTVAGDVAVYNPTSRSARVTGRPVVLKDSKGTEIRGPVVVYDFVTATAQIQSEPEDEIESP
ncbi:MAG: LPS export ABC transporter periplasmic protein LptC [Acidobacteria bacterium]|nr:MAG: LPS export ABC transporter periplasmic protein LptC [Acidobacteriota bacterium]